MGKGRFLGRCEKRGQNLLLGERCIVRLKWVTFKEEEPNV